MKKLTSFPFLSSRTETELPNPVLEMEGPGSRHKHVAGLGGPKEELPASRIPGGTGGSVAQRRAERPQCITPEE